MRVTIIVLMAAVSMTVSAQEHRAHEYKALEELSPKQLALLKRVVPQLDVKRWAVVYVDDEHMVSLDRESVKKVGDDRFELWLRRDLTTPAKMGKGLADHTLTHEAVDCAGQRFQNLKVIAYSSKGKPLVVLDLTLYVQDIVPASVGETEYAEVCHDAREVGK